MTVDSILEKNLFAGNFSALQREYPSLAEKINAWMADDNNVDTLKNSIEKICDKEETQRYTFTDQAIQYPDVIFLHGMGSDFFMIDLADQLPKSTTMFVIEPDLFVFIKTLHFFDISLLIKRWQVKFIINADTESFYKQLNQYYYPINNFVEIQHPVRHDENIDYFESISDSVSKFVENRRHASTTEKQLRFLIFAGTSGVGWPYILQDVIAALHKLGHRVRLFHLDDSNLTSELLKELRANRPDFIIMLDAIGLMPGIFEAEAIPYISWFFDNPFNWLNKKHVSDYYYTFVWDKTYVDNLKAMGFKHAHYLPLGANETVFYPQASQAQCDISFVGSSLWKIPDLPFENKAKQLFIELIAKLLCQTPWVPIWTIIDAVVKEYGTSFKLDDPERRNEFELFVQNYARTIYRKRIIQAILPLNPCLYGDQDWSHIIDIHGGTYKGRINNRIDLPVLYSNSAINLNITVPQIRDSFSHRAFEIPACGGFLLSDYRPEAESFFDLDSEIVCFKSQSELRDKANYYLRQPKERQRIAENGRKRVLAEHTYTHRIKQMIKVLTS